VTHVNVSQEKLTRSRNTPNSYHKIFTLAFGTALHMETGLWCNLSAYVIYGVVGVSVYLLINKYFTSLDWSFSIS